MTDKPGNPQAFPSDTPSGGDVLARHNSGMTLRDYFAGQALAGIMANPHRWADIEKRYLKGDLSYDEASKVNATKAYSIADAMLKDREK